MHLPRGFVSEQCSRLAVADGQISITFQPGFINHKLEGTGHGTQREHFLACIIFARFLVTQHKHTVAVMLPVPGNLIKIALRHDGSAGVLIPVRFLHVLDVTLHKLYDARALGHEKGQTLSDLGAGGEILKLSAQFIMIAL